MKKSHLPQDAILRQIAEAIGVPVEHFYMPSPLKIKINTADECLQLLSKITTEKGRQDALIALRLIVEMERR